MELSKFRINLKDQRLIIFIILLFPSVIFAYSQVLGKKDAKGQIKKQEVEQT